MRKAVRHDLEEGDAFLPQRNRIAFSLTIVSAVIFLPFSIEDFLQDRTPMGVAALGIVLVLTVNVLAIYRGKRAPIPLWALVFPVLGVLAFAVLTPVYMDLAWGYPFIILFYFILPQRTANWLAGAIVVAATALAHYASVGAEYHARVTTRLFATLALTAILSNIFINIISELQRQLRRQAIVDPLTGAYNRRHMDAVLGGAFAGAKRDTPPSLLLLDIDHFKRINDELGHAAGDDVLKQVVAVIQHHVRSSDILFRCGGEEFALFLPATGPEGALRVAEQVRKSVAEARLLGERPVTISVGVATLPPDATIDDWLRHGDSALYRAKSEGRNRVCTTAECALARGAE